MMVSSCRPGNYSHELAKGAPGQSHYLVGMIGNDSLLYPPPPPFFFVLENYLILNIIQILMLDACKKQTRMGRKCLV